MGAKEGLSTDGVSCGKQIRQRSGVWSCCGGSSGLGMDLEDMQLAGENDVPWVGSTSLISFPTSFLTPV